MRVNYDKGSVSKQNGLTLSQGVADPNQNETKNRMRLCLVRASAVFCSKSILKGFEERRALIRIKTKKYQ